MQKHRPIRSKAIRESARGETCTLQIVGICNGDPATTVLAHLPSDGHGMAQKSDDTMAVYACSSCHDLLDGRFENKCFSTQICEYNKHADWYKLRALQRTLRRLVEKGVMEVKDNMKESVE